MISNYNITRFFMGNQIQHGKLMGNRKYIDHSFEGSGHYIHCQINE